MSVLDQQIKILKERWNQKVEAMKFPTGAQPMITDESGNSLS